MVALASIDFGSLDPFNFENTFMTIKTRTSKTSTATEEQRLAVKPKRKTITGINNAGNEVMSETASLVNESFAANPGVFLEGLDQPVTGRSVFAVRTLGNTVSVESVFVKEDGNVLRLPAVFPDRQYALSQIDELRQIVIQHFDELEKQLSNSN
jgi:hypothetical protein